MRSGAKASDPLNSPPLIQIDCYCEGNPLLPYDVGAFSAGQAPGIFRGFVPPNTLTFSSVDRIVLFVPSGDYWQLVFEKPSLHITGEIPKLPLGSSGWWHQFHRVDTRDPERGKGIKIGVIDEALPRHQSGPLADIINLGGEAWRARGNRPYESLGSGHGEMVCSVLGAKVAGSRGFEGIAPGATIYFCAAGADDKDKLAAPRLAESINHLATVKQCDIITFSAGDASLPVPEVESALEDATDAGVLCFAAAGNLGKGPLYPACYPDCLSVGALGRVGLAPPQTEDRQDASRSTVVVGNEFLWPSSARGPLVKFMGAGASIFYTEPGGGSFAVSGTSFAAPIVAGTAALLLEKDQNYQSVTRDRKRVEYALGKLRSMSFNPFANHASIGILRAGP